jgi:hypothetical protein
MLSLLIVAMKDTVDRLLERWITSDMSEEEKYVYVKTHIVRDYMQYGLPAPDNIEDMITERLERLRR